MHTVGAPALPCPVLSCAAASALACRQGSTSSDHGLQGPGTLLHGRQARVRRGGGNTLDAAAPCCCSSGASSSRGELMGAPASTSSWTACQWQQAIRAAHAQREGGFPGNRPGETAVCCTIRECVLCPW